MNNNKFAHWGPCWSKTQSITKDILSSKTDVTLIFY